MHEGPVVVGWLLAALCGGTGLYCLHRARAGPGPVARRPAALEGAMGLGMAVMAVPGAGTAIPGQTYVLAFGALAVWAVVLRARPVHRAHHAVEALAMVWMAAAMPGHAGAAGHGGAHGAGGGLPVPTGMLIAYFALYVLVSGARIAAVAQMAGSPAPAVAGAGAAGGGSTPPGYGGGEPSPAVAVACRTALSLGMLVMLVSM